MEKLEREKWESESKAHIWKMDFQDLCQTYEVTGCNKATLYYMSALQLREQIQDNALKKTFYLCNMRCWFSDGSIHRL